jgi:outer membrane protein
MLSPTTRALAALLVVPVALAAQGTDPIGGRPIALREAVAQAQENGVQAVTARGQVRNAESAVRTARGALLPNLTLSMGQVNQSGDRLDTQGRLVPYAAPQPWTYSTGLTSNLNLFDGGRRLSDLRRSRYDVSSAEANEVTQRYNVALNVKIQYYSILAAREAEAAANAQLQQADEQLKSSNARVHAGVATVSDSLRSVVALGNAQLALLTAQNNVRIASASLTRLIGSEVMVTALPSDTLDQGLSRVDSAAIAAIVEQGPLVKQSQAQLESAHAAEKSAKTSFLPSVDLTYSRSGNGYSQAYGLNGQDLAYTNNFSLRLSYSLFNNFSREDALVRANTTAEQADATLRDTRLAARQTFVQQLGAIQTAQQRIAIQNASVDAAKEDLRVQTQRYAMGASLLLDVLTSQSTLNAARSALIQARQDVRVARAQLEALIGQDLP